MTLRVPSFLAIALLLAAPPPAPASAAAVSGAARINASVKEPDAPFGRTVLVRFREEAGPRERRKAHGRAGALGGRALYAGRNLEAAQLPPGADAERVAARYRLDPSVARVEVVLDRRVTVIPKDLLVQQWAFHNIGQTVAQGVTGTPDADIDMVEAWDLATGSKDIVVAVLDTGVDQSRGDLSKRLVGGYDFANNDGNPQDDEGHGTAVASVIGAMGNNKSGMTGLNWKVSLMPIKICRANGTCPGDAIIDGIYWAVDHGADVINMSLSCDENANGSITGCSGQSPGACFSSDERDAISYALAAGVIVVSAAGNCGGSNDDATSAYPCAHDQAHNICVGSTDVDDDISFFSNEGTQAVDFGAPGEWIPVYDISPPGGIYFQFGTSFSSPITAGVAALLLSRSTFTPGALLERLAEAADPGQGLGSHFEHGRVNAFKAIADVFKTGLVYADHSPGDFTLLADITGDGRADLVRGTQGFGFELAKNNGKKKKFAGMRLKSETPPTDWVGAGDVDGDGREDLILGDTSAGFDVIRSKNKKGALLPVESWSATPLATTALAGDVDGDGRTDVVNVNGGFDVMLSTGTSFGSASTWSAASPGDFTALADADGDGSADLILWSSAAGVTTVLVGLSDGSSAFGSASAWAAFDQLDFAAAGDFDADGDDDLAGVNPADGCISVLLSDGGAFEDPWIWTCPGVASHWFAGRAGKNRDFRLDMVTRQSSTGRWLMLESAH